IVLAGVMLRHGSYFCREQTEQRTIFVGCPNHSIAPQKTCARAFFAAKTKRTVEQTRCEIFESDGHFDEFAMERVDDSVNHAAAHEGFANRGIFAQLRTMREQILNRDREIMI